MDRKEKIQLLKDLEAGKTDLKQLRPICFVQMTTYENVPGVYYDESEKAFNEEELQSLIKKKKEKFQVCFLEISLRDKEDIE